MRVLMLATPSPSHVTPLLPLVSALRGADHEVLMAGQPDVLEVARTAGISAVRVGDTFDGQAFLRRGLRDGERPLQTRPRPARETVGGYGRVWLANARTVLADILDLARHYRPDLVLCDPLEYTSLVVGGALNVPVVHHRWGVDIISGPARELVRPHLRELAEQAGAEPLSEPTVLLDPCPPALQDPQAQPGTPIRSLPSNGSGLLPDWLWQEERAAGTRRVAVSFGGDTLALNGVPFVRGVLRAFDGLPSDVEAVATVPAVYREQIGPVPPSVRMVDPVPLHLLLGTCQAMVHHGGAGSTMTATRFGLAQLALPQLADHFAHGDRLAAAGAGLALDTAAQQDDPQRLHKALATLLSEPALGRTAQQLARDMTAMPAPSRVVPALEELAR